ncbi:MAG: glycoside hydrolase, partial [Bacteroidota bacterium]
MPKLATLSLFVLVLVFLTGLVKAQDGFPFILPKEKPNRPLSAAMERNYSRYPAPRPEDNELYTQFRYTEIAGFDYNDYNGTISRRDPSKVIHANGKYYVW